MARRGDYIRLISLARRAISNREDPAGWWKVSGFEEVTTGRFAGTRTLHMYLKSTMKRSSFNSAPKRDSLSFEGLLSEEVQVTCGPYR